MLIDGKKFDLRIYVMVVSLGQATGEPMIAFVAEEGLVRLCTEEYETPSKDNISNVLSHLTNFSLNKRSDKFVNVADLDDQCFGASKRTLSFLYDKLAKDGVNVTSIKEQIHDVC